MKSVSKIVVCLLISLFPGSAQAIPLQKLPQLLTIGLQNTAKEFCSCIYISERSPEACQDYARITQFPVRLALHPTEKRVRSRAFIDLWPMPSATAEFFSESEGCRVLHDGRF